MSFLPAIVIGVIAGGHAATWGLYKDSPYEGVRPYRFWRSVALAVVVATGLVALTRETIADADDLVPFFGVVYALERLITEWWKLFLRADDTAVHTIPMRFAVFGRVVRTRALRYGVGVIIAAGLAALTAAEYLLQPTYRHAPDWLLVVTIGGIAGWLTAIGGAWKDAPVEGFQPLKFLRSPVVATGWAVVVAVFTTDWMLIVIAAGGYSVASIETYKTLRTRAHPPGKFADQPIRYPFARDRLHWCAPAYAGLWLLVAAGLTIALSEPHAGALPL